MRQLVHSAVFALTVAVVSSACASRRPKPENDPVALAAVRADVRVVRGETTLVVQGAGYELVGRTKADLVAVKSSLDRASNYMRAIYPGDSVATIVVTTRRMAPPGKPFVTAVPVPPEATRHIVELVIADPKAMEEQRRGGGGAPPPMVGAGMPGVVVATPAVRAWLAGRATVLTGTSGRSNQMSGEVEDPRVPAWAFDLVSAAGNDTLIDNLTRSLSANPESVIPLAQFFAMSRPPMMTMAGREGAGGAPPGGTGAPGGGIGGGRGGMGGGGRGGMGGAPPGGGRGGMPGGGPPGGGMGGPGGPGGRGGSGGAAGRAMPLQGAMLFSAQAAALSKYLGRLGPGIVGDLIDAQVKGLPVADVLAKHQLGDIERVDRDWKAWLAERGAVLNRR